MKDLNQTGQSRCEAEHEMRLRPPEEATSPDPEVLRAALIRESTERQRAVCIAKIQTDVVQLALDLLVREPDVEGFFGVFAKTLVDESDSHGCGVWLIDGGEPPRCPSVWRPAESVGPPTGRRLATPASPARTHSG